MLFQVSFACFISSIIEVILAQFYFVLYYLANTGPKGYLRLVLRIIRIALLLSNLSHLSWFLRTCSVWSSRPLS